MKVVEKADATATLATYADEVENGPLIITQHGQPIAALVPLVNADLETIGLSTNREFLDLIALSRTRLATEGGISAEEMRNRFR